MIKSNFHTHTCYCDGRDTPEELVLYAVEHGFEMLGFSGHSYLELDRDCSMSDERLAKYIADVNALKEKYKDKITILLGIEQDYFSKAPAYKFDYVIGSVHYILKDGQMLPVDISADIQNENVSRYYNGDFDAYAEDYFLTVSDLIDRTNADIIGHFDLISKYCEITGYRETERYLTAAEKAVKKLAKTGRPFEINTGAMARGYRTTPYPSENILSFIKNNGGKILFSSDCHDKNYLDFGFNKAYDLVKRAGFTEYATVAADKIEYRSF